MKRTFSLIILLLMVHAIFAVNVTIAPYNGAFNVSMSSDVYQGGSGGWAGNASYPLTDDKTQYKNEEMIALAGFGGLTWEQINYGHIKISVSCPNGFYFVSQSNPAFRRPFELELVWTAQKSYGSQIKFPTETYNIRISENMPEKEIPAIFNRQEQWGTVGGNLWCDIILVLPFDDMDVNTDTLTANSKQYPLIPANDYTALVSITVEFVETGESDTITIPFFGYYSRDEKTQESTCSMFVDPYAKAARLDIQNDRGKWIPVGSIDFLMSAGAGKTLAETPRIFASSSRNPEEPSPGRFQLVHEDVTYDTPLTQTNRIYYDVRINRASGTGTQSYTFDGTDNLDSCKNDDSFGISPGSETGGFNHTNPITYYTYDGEIEVMMEGGTNIMAAGSYQSSIFIHVVTES